MSNNYKYLEDVKTLLEWIIAPEVSGAYRI